MDAKIYPNLQSVNFLAAIHVDPNGYVGTEYPIGTPEWPCSTWADARTISGIRLHNDLVLRGLLALDAAMQNYNFHGYNSKDLADGINLAGFDVDGSSFHNLVMTGNQGGAGYAYYIDSVLFGVTGLRGEVLNCRLYSQLTLATGGGTDYINFYNCYTQQAVVDITVNAPDLVNFYGFKGDMRLNSMTGGIMNIWAADGALIDIQATCTGGTINIYGNARVTDNSAGTVVNHRYLDFAIEENNDILSGTLVQVPFFVTMDTIVNNVITLFSFDALGATIRDVFISFYLPLHATATFTPTWEKTRAGDLVTFVAETTNPFSDAAYAAIATPAANAVYRYHLGEIAQGLQGRFRIAQSNHAGAVSVDAFAVVLMEL